MKTQVEKSIGYYEDRSRKLGKEKAMYAKAEVQRIRFLAAAKNLEMAGKGMVSVLDIGCGFGGFLSFLFSDVVVTGTVPNRYLGVDPWETAISKCWEYFPREDYPIAEFARLSVKDLWEMDQQQFDYVTVLSVFSHRAASLYETEELFMDTVELAYRWCNKGCAITALSPYKTEAVLQDAIFDPMWMWQVGRRLSERVMIDHTYAPHESMLVLFKEKSEFRKVWEKEGGWNVDE